MVLTRAFTYLRMLDTSVTGATIRRSRLGTAQPSVAGTVNHGRWGDVGLQDEAVRLDVNATHGVSGLTAAFILDTLWAS